MEQILNYYWAERLSGITMLIAGGISLSISFYLILKSKKSFYKGFGHCLLILAIWELSLGLRMYTRTPGDIQKATEYFNNDKTGLIIDELPRMEQVQGNFVRTFAIGLFILALAIYVFFFTTHKLWKGVALALILNLGLILFNYYFASQRGEKYLLFLTAAANI
jgi:hypothetical protein